jgi:glycosyltransferase involved in cell wall biosynthesis
LGLLDLGVPILYEVNGLASLELKESHPDLTETVRAKIAAAERECLKRASKVICPSERTSRFLADAYDFRDAHVIPNGYNPIAKHIETPPERTKLKVAYVGTLHPWQGLLWSLKNLRDVNVELHLFSPDHKIWTSLLNKRIRKKALHQQVILREPLAHSLLLKELSCFDAGFAPLLKVARNSEQGCFPIKNLDYLAAGLPVIASDLFVNRQLLNESNAVFFEPNRLSSLAEVWAKETPQSIRRLRAGARRSLTAHPTWDDYSLQIEAIYDSLCGARARTRQTLSSTTGAPL